MDKTKEIRCDRWRKTGAFQVGGGTGKWEQCPNKATSRVHIEPQHLGDWQQDQGCCDSCYAEFIEHYYRPHKVIPLYTEQQRNKIKEQLEQEFSCAESPDHRHEFTPDLEYDPSGATENCEWCGELKPE